jgi:hypothetical protein
MRTTFPLALILSIGIALLMFSGSGFNAIVEGSQEPGELGENINEEANQSAVQASDSVGVENTGEDDGSIAGLIISGGSGIVQTISLVATAPVTLQRLGFPAWFALPVGSLIYIVVGVGIFQVLSGRTYE